ncbi:MAG: ZPR1 zinc finger domain-containing protein [Candidatus Woesearchaeota archaeon]|nr:ZPR1 zinc finger domain-containing protein [Candidatus Woesearchaeota archaeon]
MSDLPQEYMHPAQMDRYIPFGKKEILIYVFSMTCSSCRYHKADVEFSETNEPCKITMDIDKEDDMKIMLIRSGEATVKIPHITTIEGGPTSNGYITTVEGLFNRVKKVIEQARDSAEDEEDRKKAKNLLKKITRIMWGQEPCKITIEDKSGNSEILSEKAVKTKL